MDIGENAMETVTRELTPTFYTEDGEKVELSRIHTDTESVRATVPISLVKDVALRINFIESPGARLSDMEWSLSPSTVRVSGEASILGDLDTLTLDSFDLLGVGPDQTHHSYAIILPEGCENLSGESRANLRISFPGKTTVEIQAGVMLLENLQFGKYAEILSPAPEVTLFGSRSVLENMTSEDISLVSDLSDYSGANGTYTVPARVSVRGDPDLGVSGEYELQVRISEAPPEEPEPGESPEDSEAESTT